MSVLTCGLVLRDLRAEGVRDDLLHVHGQVRVQVRAPLCLLALLAVLWRVAYMNCRGLDSMRRGEVPRGIGRVGVNTGRDVSLSQVTVKVATNRSSWAASCLTFGRAEAGGQARFLNLAHLVPEVPPYME